MSIPVGCTHVAEFYGETIYYKMTVVRRVSFAIDDVITDVSFFYWSNGWITTGAGFSPRRLKPIS